VKKHLLISDLHCGSLVGLTPERLIDERTERTQLPLWRWWKKELKKIGPVDTCIVNGDAIDGPGVKDTIGHLSTDTEYQREIAIEILKEIRAKKYLFTYGTQYHVTGSEDWENGIAEHFNAPIKDMLYVNLGGYRCRFRHHAGRSDIPYGQGTQLFKEAIRDLLMAIMEEEKEAEYLFHSHVHYYFRAENVHQVAVSTPCLQVPESVYGRKCRSMYYDLGMLELRPEKEELRVIKHIMPIKFVRKREYINV